MTDLHASVVEDCGTACYDAGLYKEAEKYFMIAEAADPEKQHTDESHGCGFIL